MAESVRRLHDPDAAASPEAWRYLPLIVAGVLIVLFSIEHIIALRARRRGRSRAWH